MAALAIHTDLWEQLVRLARKKRKKPEVLAEIALRDYVQRLQDEDLLARSERAARATKFNIQETENLIRQGRVRPGAEDRVR